MKFVIKREHKINCCPNPTLAIPQTIYCFKDKLTEDLVSCVENLDMCGELGYAVLNSRMKKTLQLF